MEKSFRVHTSIGKDTLLSVPLRQDMDFMEILSLRLRQNGDSYKLHSSNYGVIVGRVLANDAFGIPNAKVSVFIKVDDDETVENKNLYPYKSVTSTDGNNIRYNILPDDSNDECYQVVGTFPDKTELLDNDTKIEVFDKYWKYTTVTNNSGDYMLFGIPVGNQQVHVDIDLSDIGVLSQKPRDMLTKGYTMSDFNSSNQFKSSTNLDNLAQIISQDTSVYVYPYWGDTDNGVIGITRSDVQVNYKFEPTCVFLGSLVSDNGTNAIGHECSPQKKNGRNAQLVAGEGTIEMIRKTQDGLVEDYPIEGNRLIDSNGVWCYQIPMNLDYVGTDEYGNICPTEDPSKGIPTRTRVRFRISKDDDGNEGFSRHTAKLLVPNNPTLMPEKVVPTVENGAEVEKSYIFGSATPDEHFRDLYWNRVYSVKSYIPRFQTSTRQNTEYYSAIKSVNVTEDQNVVPFNRLNIKLPFVFVIVCILFKMLILVVQGINVIINLLYATILCPSIKLPLIGRINFWCWKIFPCIKFEAGLEDTDNVMYLPGCDCPDGGGCQAADCTEPGCTKTGSSGALKDKVEQKLAQSYNIVHLDLYNDWVNGMVYLPLWYWRVRKKKSFFFGLITLASAKNDYCTCDKNKSYKHIISVTSCDLGLNDEMEYKGGNGDNKYHTSSDYVSKVSSHRGIIKPIENEAGQTVYYYTSMLPSSENDNSWNRDFGDYTGATKIIRSFATDIILLGSLNDNDIEGIPALYDRLPGTTANVPNIATVNMSSSSDEEDTGDENEAMLDETTGTSVITGMDWERNYDDDVPRYGKGLFMDVGCTKIRTKPKSCINAARLCELNVSMDMGYNMQYPTSADVLESGRISTDGMINKMEIETNENRGIFATLNHLGFLPTNVAEQKLKISTQVKDPITSYYTNKFQFIYPTDFDGRMYDEAIDYTSDGQKTYDNKDQAYLRFRFGYGGEDGKYKFYNVSNSEYHFPLYNNSFYFCFGIKPGDTAIDKFRTIYDATCAAGKKYAFTLDVLARENKSCITNAADTNHSFIYADLSDIQTPFSYSLANGNGAIIINETGINAKFLTIGTSESESTLTLESETDGKIYYHDASNGYPTGNSKDTLTNGAYILTITDVNGYSLTKHLTLDYARISVDCQTVDLSKKYYAGISQQIDLCNSKEYHGDIVFNSVSIDGNDYTVTSITTVPEYSEHILSKSHLDIIIQCEGVTALAEIMPTFDAKIDDCFCTLPHPEGAPVEKSNHLAVFIPGDYLIQVTQICNVSGLNTKNTSSIIVTVNNYIPFNLYLNNVPFKFIIGEPKVGNVDNPSKYNANFYSASVATEPSDKSFVGWYKAFDESMYSFSTTSKLYQSIWGEFLDIEGLDMSTVKHHIAAVQYKLQKIVDLCNAIYFISDGMPQLSVTSTGGLAPILFRGMRPAYDDFSKGITNQVKFGSIAHSTCDDSHPDIVSCNYSTEYDAKTAKGDNIASANTPYFNFDYAANGQAGDIGLIGNYFAGFTNNGGSTEGGQSAKPDAPIESVPVYANPYSDESITKIQKIANFGSSKGDVYESGTTTYPYLRAFFIDRRLDYDYFIIGGNIGTPFEDPLADGIRISGITYNGVEMAYDEDNNYSIINENSQDLEYTYTIAPNSTTSNADSYLTWNTLTTQPRRFYSATLNGIDIRNRFVSKYNAATQDTGSMNEVYNYTGSFVDVTSDNGYFMEEYKNDSSSGLTYPTKRGLYIDSLPSLPVINLNISSCSYEIKTETDYSKVNLDKTSADYIENQSEITTGMVQNAIVANTKEGEKLELTFTYGNPIVLENSELINDNYNVAVENTDGTIQGISFDCHINPLTIDDHSIASKLPWLMTVDDTGVAFSALKRTSIEDDIPTAVLSQYCFRQLDTITSAPDGVEIEDGYLIKDNEVITDNDSEFTSIKLHTDISGDDLKAYNIERFTTIAERFASNSSDDHLLKRIHFINTGYFYDARPFGIVSVTTSVSSVAVTIPLGENEAFSVISGAKFRLVITVSEQTIDTIGTGTLDDKDYPTTLTVSIDSLSVDVSSASVILYAKANNGLIYKFSQES